MSRTRKKNQREPRTLRLQRYAEWDALPIGAFPDYRYYWRKRRGGMLMSPANTGLWDDEYGSGRDGDRDRRNQKRSERQKWRREEGL